MNRLILNYFKPTFLIVILSIFFTLISSHTLAETDLSAIRDYGKS